MSQSLTWTQRPADAHTARHAQPGGWAVVLLVYVLGCRFAAYLLGAKLVAVAGVAFEPIGLLEHPVNMFERPCQLVVVGLVIGVVLTVPVVLAAVAGAFWGVGAGVSAAVLGPSPLLGLASAAGAVLVGLRRVPRVSPGKRLAIALALAPSVWLVWVVISPTGNLPGAARWVACVPIAVAGLVAAGAWRPAARHDAAGPTDSSVWGVACAVLLTASAALVHGAVGWDEIRFGSLLREHGPDAGHFVSTPIDARQPRESAQTDTTDARRRRSLSGVQAAIHVQQYLAERKQAASAAWLAFTKHYASSRHAPEILLLLARTLDTRVDFRGLDRHQCLLFDGSEPTAEGIRFWTQLVEHYPHAPETAAALERIGRHWLRQGDMARAAANLREVLRRFGDQAMVDLGEPLSVSTPAELFTSATRRRHRRRWRVASSAVARARHDLWLIDASQPHWPAALERYSRAVPRTAAYKRQLERALEALPHGPLRQIIEIDLAAAWPDPDERVARLDALGARPDLAPQARHWACYRHMLALVYRAHTRRDPVQRRVDLIHARHYVPVAVRALEQSCLRPLVTELGERIDRWITRASGSAD